MTATPEGVSSTLVKYSYLRLGVDTKGVDSEADEARGGANDDDDVWAAVENDGAMSRTGRRPV